jgi:hypothetical protein
MTIHRALFVLVAAVVICASGKAGVAMRKPAVSIATPKSSYGTLYSVDGLHVAKPPAMAKLPDGLVPLP